MRAAGTIGRTAQNPLPQTSEQNLNGPPDEQHERRNFLTWAFFLAQVSAAELLLTGPTKAQDVEIAQNPVNHLDPQSGAVPNEVMRKFDVAEAEINAPSSNSVIAQNVAPDIDTSAPTHPLPLSAIAGDTPPAGAAGSAGSTQQARIGSSGSTDNSLPTLLPDVGVTPPPPPITVDIGLTPTPGFDVNVDVGGLISANIGLDPNGLNLNLDLLGLDLDGLLVSPLQDATNLLVDPLQDVTGLVDSLTADLGHLMNGDVLGLGDLLQSSPLNLGDLTGLTLNDGLAGLLGQGGDSAPALLSPVSGAAASEPALAAVSGANDFSALDLFGGGGVINILGGATNAPAQLDDLYALGRYTDYNIALRDNAEPAAGDAAARNRRGARRAATSDGQPPADTVVAELLPFDDLLARPAI